ncbi:MAG: MBL fold metallo-hydrolase [Betaproteobacteria bacterium]|nr:MBL fold metallo-hydrolase [Betaproteobacteria bacterium]
MRARRAELRLTHFGAAGWSITDGAATLLLDPYFSRVRFKNRPYGAPDAATVPRDPRPVVDYTEVPTHDTGTVDRHVARADFVLLSHSHFNHAMDMPHIARKTSATVIGTESTANIARASGVPDAQIITARGGEDFEFDRVSIKVIPSLHSALSNKHYWSSAAIPRDVKMPLRLKDYVEGGTLAYMVRIGGRQLLLFGGMNYIEREVAGLRPDVALIAAAKPRREIHDYTGRLLRALGRPRIVVATHWDNQGLPFGAPQDEARAEADTFVAEVKAVSPRTRVVVPAHFQTIVLDGRGALKKS